MRFSLDFFLFSLIKSVQFFVVFHRTCAPFGNLLTVHIDVDIYRIPAIHPVMSRASFEHLVTSHDDGNIYREMKRLNFIIIERK